MNKLSEIFTVYVAGILGIVVMLTTIALALVFYCAPVAILVGVIILSLRLFGVHI